MKRLIIMIACLVPMLYAYDQSKTYALTHGGAKVDTFVRVVDESGRPIPNAKVVACFYNGIAKSKDTFCRGFSNSEGVCRISGMCKYNMTIYASNDAYYMGWVYDKLSEMEVEPAIVDGIWQTPKAGYQIVLKRPQMPMSLIRLPEKAKSLRRKIPIYSEWIGYDLEKWDFCKPFGTGEADDILLRFGKTNSRAKVMGQDICDYSLEISFTNHPYGGFYLKQEDARSHLKYDHSAITNKTAYTPYLKYELKFGEDGYPLLWSKLNDGEYMVIRTRTKVDENDNIVSANYARIAGNVGFYDKFTVCRGWFNPNVNDPNLEDGDYWAYLERERAKQKKNASKGFFDFLKRFRRE